MTTTRTTYPAFEAMTADEQFHHFTQEHSFSVIARMQIEHYGARHQERHEVLIREPHRHEETR